VLNENAGEGNDRVFSTTSFSLGANLEELTLTGSGNTNGNGNILSNHLVGNSGNNILNGGSGGNDSIEGGSGADSLIGGTGDDTMVGGAGNDTMVGGAGTDAYVVMAGDTLSETLTGTDGGIDRVFSSTSFSLGGNLENLTLTGTANINATGNILGNRLTGNSGNNVLTGNGGNDLLDGLGGNDTMIGGVGNDTYVLGAGDTISETTAGSAGGTDTVLSNVSHTIGANIENLTLPGSSNLNGVGNSLDNLVTGNTGNNVLSSLDGADTLIGGGGADTLLGGAGDDTIAIADTAFGRLDGGTGTDTLRLDGSGLSLDLATFGVRVAGIERIDMGGTGNHSLTLSAADVLADSDTDQLVVLGDSGDQVTATGTWTANGTQTIEGQTYNVYTGGGATLLVDSDIVQNVPTS
jgi:Ca2+-binding RTX toxin-like protein